MLSFPFNFIKINVDNMSSINSNPDHLGWLKNKTEMFLSLKFYFLIYFDIKHLRNTLKTSLNQFFNLKHL
jgi:hypothetical protein